MLTLEEFRRTARIDLEAECEGILYFGGAARIDLIVGGRQGDPAHGCFMLTIANSSEQGFDLARFEAVLFEWAKSEGIC